ncbi:MAG TPA: hypothetical protein VMU13_02570 [Candidatus Paceibacterota bacterium]|nr:hypothetical protein [Candidatus Paceibacterota bacterium]
MILSQGKILEALKNGALSIIPFIEGNLKEASYTFTLGNKLRKLKTAKELDSRNDPDFEEIELTSKGYLLQPQDHILGTTTEHLSLRGNFACILSTRATIAQLGLDVSQGSIYCEPDTDNPLTLEISNSSTIPVRLFPGIKIVKGIFVTIQK